MSTTASRPAPSLEKPRPPAPAAPALRDYAGALGLILAVIVALSLVTRLAAGEAAAETLLGPMLAMFVVTFLVWVAMLVARNYAVLRGLARGDYYVDYAPAKLPPDWIERPARTFNNLMQLPSLFYVVCLLMLLTGVVDRPQIIMAWIFVALRAVHAVVYIVWNHVPTRFSVYGAGFVTLCFLWVRFAVMTWHLW